MAVFGGRLRCVIEKRQIEAEPLFKFQRLVAIVSMHPVARLWFLDLLHSPMKRRQSSKIQIWAGPCRPMCFTIGRPAALTAPHVRQRENALQELTGVCVAGRQVTRHPLRTCAQNQITHIAIGKRLPPDLAGCPRGLVPFQPWPMHFDNIWVRKGVYGRCHRCWAQYIIRVQQQDHISAAQ